MDAGGLLFAMLILIVILAAMAASMRRGGHTPSPVGSAGGGKGCGGVIALAIFLGAIFFAAALLGIK